MGIVDSEIEPTCPNCGGSDIAAILWGMPAFSEDLERDLEEGWIVLGGCVISVENPRWHCNECGMDF